MTVPLFDRPASPTTSKQWHRSLIEKFDKARDRYMSIGIKSILVFGSSLIQRGRSRRIAIWFFSLVLTIASGYLAGRLLSDWQREVSRMKARSLADEGAMDVAIAAYQRHLLQSPNDFAARLELAQYLQRRKPLEALQEFRQIPPTATEFTKAARAVASLSMTLERDYDAIEPLGFLEEKFPNEAGIQQALAEIYFRQREFDKSLEHARRFRALKPDSVESCLLIAESSDSLGQMEAMIEPLEWALRLDPEIPQAHLNLAFALQSAGRSEEAFSHVRWFVDRYPLSVSGNRILALIERSRDHDVEALAAAEKASQLGPANLDCAILVADMLLYLRRYEEAYDKLEKLAVDWPREPRVLTPLLRAAVLCRKPERIQELQSILQKIEVKE
jgi:tetratricopeptide (TPR) repeat protein